MTCFPCHVEQTNTNRNIVLLRLTLSDVKSPFSPILQKHMFKVIVSM